MAAPKNETIDIDRDEGDGCGACLPCRFRRVVDDMEDALEMLRAGRKKEAERFLCSAVATAKTSFEEWADEAGYWDEDEEDGKDFDLANTPTAGRA